MTNIAIENGPVKIVSFPIKNMAIFPGYAHVYQSHETLMGTKTVFFFSWDLPWETGHFSGSTVKIHQLSIGITLW